MVNSEFVNLSIIPERVLSKESLTLHIFKIFFPNINQALMVNLYAASILITDFNCCEILSSFLKFKTPLRK